jgi:TRAP-type uncharacterized transport system fused permease subunit
MLLIDVQFGAGILMVLTSMAGIISVSAGVMAYLMHPMLWWERIVFIVGGVLMVMPGTYTDLIGLVVVAAGVAVQISRKRAASKVAKA